MWQAAPTWSTLSSSVSPSQSRRTSLTYCAWPEVSPLTQYSWRERLQYVARRVVEGAGQRLVVHPAEHQHLARVVLLDDDGDEALGRVLQASGDRRVQGGVGPLVMAPSVSASRAAHVSAQRCVTGPGAGRSRPSQRAIGLHVAGGGDEERLVARAPTSIGSSTSAAAAPLEDQRAGDAGQAAAAPGVGVRSSPSTT